MLTDPESKPNCLDSPNGVEPAVGNYFVSTYPPFSTWRPENVDAVRRVLEAPPADDVPLGLYVHIPFCAKRCDFCYYLSYADKTPDHMRAYVDRLIEELTMYGATPALAGRKPLFVYFGGGTPSLLPPELIEKLIGGLTAVFPWTNAAEVTFECAPQTVTERKLRILRDAGVTRISLGVQQFDDTVLKANGRIHQVADVERAYATIREFGFDVVNIDLITGLIGETEATFMASVDRAIELGAESVTIYQLEMPQNTPLYRSWRDGATDGDPADWADKRQRLGKAFARLEQARYTVRSAYGAVRDPVRHRFVYQEAQYRGADLLGLGAASFSFLGGVHHQNLASLEAYTAALEAGDLPLGRAHRLGDDERLVREFVLQLKLGGADAGYFRDKFDVDVRQRFAEPLARCSEAGWLVAGQDGVRMTRQGLLRVDRLIPAFYRPEHAVTRYT